MGSARLATLLALAAFPMSALGQPRVGVVVIGPDPAAVAAAQKTLDAKLATVPATVRGAELAPALAGPQPATAHAWTNDPVARAAFEAALADAKKAYFSDLMPQASAKLDEAAAILDRSLDVPGTIRVKVPLWRAAVALRRNQKDAAASEVNVALLLVPNLEVEPNSPPPVVALLSDARAKAPKPFRVQLSGVPANAVVKVDDVVLAADAIAVLPGTHVLDVIVPGFRPFNTAFDAKGDVTLAVALVPAIGAAWEKAFDAITARGNVVESERKSLESLASRERLDFVVLASVRPGETRGVVWRRADGSAPSGSGADPAAFAAWAAQQITSKPAPAAVPSATPVAAAAGTPAAVATPAVAPGGIPARPRDRRTHLAAEAGIGYARWDRTVDPKSGNGYAIAGLGGAGPRVRVRAGRGAGVTGGVDVSYFTFGTMEVTDPDDDGDTVSVPGGSLLQARAGVGWAIAFGKDRERATTITPSVGGFYESHTAQDVPGEDVFPSHTRAGADVRVTANIAAGPAGIVLEAGAVPFSTWSEDPDGVTGNDPAPGVAPFFRAGVDLPAGRRGRVALDVSSESRSVQYSGAGKSGLDPVDAKRSELLTVVGASFRYRF